MKRIIVADYIIYGNKRTCLVSLDGREETLERMVNNPTKNDLRLIKTGTNLRFEELADKDCWWLHESLD